MLDQQRGSGREPTQAWTENFGQRAIVHGELTAAAVAGGVPVEWVDQARARGTKRIRWNTNLFLRPAAPIDRDALLQQLGADYERLARFCGIHAAYSEFMPAQGSKLPSAVDNVVNTLWRRSTQIGVLLGVDGAQAAHYWPHQRWMETATAAAVGLGPDQLARQWHEIAATNIAGYAVQSMALSKAEIDPDPQFAAPEPETVLSALAQRDRQRPVLFSDAAGAHISAAVDATASTSAHTDYDPLVNPPLFSDRPGNYRGVEP
ncbi:hypothetical protein [Nocardia sp. NPDC058497]|uniref:hypothetical protein n=1 Tax=Nocardia sp. NPDC058497 TaxID=3346529 RepID=UPI0036557BF1